MFEDNCSRRAFLKRFALVSAGTVATLSAATLGCPGIGVYGPAPAPSGPMIKGIYFLDPQSQKIALDNSQSVPVNAAFVVDFNYLMSNPTTVSLTDYQNYPVDFETKWNDTFTLSVTPTSNLLFNTEYRLIVDAEQKSADPNSTILANNTATFKTAAA